MRLINTHTLRFHEFGEAIVPYAILPHTWGTEELTYQMMCAMTADVTNKKGYEKVSNFCRVAREKSYDYAWVDTCCIDKNNPTELSEAINSMFRWYAKADCCIVFLADIGSLDWCGPGIQHDQLPLFRRNRWFKRGWTLQELIAPRDVHFYSCDWQFLFRKSDVGVTASISEITGIDLAVLEGSRPPGSFCVATRMSWAAHRKTTREEDLAYCLLGLFEINISLIYGEGEKAFQRLQEEIIRTSSDRTVFGWEMTADAEDTTKSRLAAPVLAPTPACFSNVRRYLVKPDELPERGPRFLQSPQPFLLTNLGIRIDVSLIITPRGQSNFVVLDPPLKCNDIHSICVEVVDNGYGDLSMCYRCQGESRRLSQLSGGRFAAREIFISASDPYIRTLLSDHTCLTGRIKWWTTNGIADTAVQVQEGFLNTDTSWNVLLVLCAVVSVALLLWWDWLNRAKPHAMISIVLCLGNSETSELLKFLMFRWRRAFHTWTYILSRLCNQMTSYEDLAHESMGLEHLYIMDSRWLQTRWLVWALQFHVLLAALTGYIWFHYRFDHFDLRSLKIWIFGVVAVSYCLEVFIAKRVFRRFLHYISVLSTYIQRRMPAVDHAIDNSSFLDESASLLGYARHIGFVIWLAHISGALDWIFSWYQAM